MRLTGIRVATVVLIGLASGAGARADDNLPSVPRMRLEEFKKEAQQDNLLVIDVRSAEAYRAGHIPGAINVPLSNWSDHLARLKASKKPIVAYCA